jgi:hypothetical protein
MSPDQINQNEFFIKRGHKKHFSDNVALWKQEEMVNDLLNGGISKMRKKDRMMKGKM